MVTRVTRLAPSPTGTLHLGNLRTFLVNWALARQAGWRIALRIEDLDAQRTRQHSAAQIIRVLEWIGIDWDEGPRFQSHDLEPYRDAMRRLAASGAAYACSLTRKQIEQAASAPHAGDQETPFPRELRSSRPEDFRFDRQDTNYRFVVAPGEIAVEDRFAGLHRFSPDREIGDFIIWTKLGVPSYQLAVVVDDAAQGVTDVVRGDDLLPSAARQELLYRALGLRPPSWFHLPLVLGPDGRRLAKRDRQLHVERCMASGVPPERVIGLLAGLSGIGAGRGPMPLADFLGSFRIDTLPKSPVMLSAEDLEWLMQSK